MYYTGEYKKIKTVVNPAIEAAVVGIAVKRRGR